MNFLPMRTDMSALRRKACARLPADRSGWGYRRRRPMRSDQRNAVTARTGCWQSQWCPV